MRSLRAQRQAHAAQHHLVAVAGAHVFEDEQRIGARSGSRNSKENGAAGSGASSSIFASIFMRLCACRALVALARKRSMNDCRCSRCCFSNWLCASTSGRARPRTPSIARAAAELALGRCGPPRSRPRPEIAVVRDDEQRPGIALEPLLEPDDGVEVEVVGRLVEQEQLRRAHQRLREIQTHAPAAEKLEAGF